MAIKNYELRIMKEEANREWNKSKKFPSRISGHF
jgi:hypothetical protein